MVYRWGEIHSSKSLNESQQSACDMVLDQRRTVSTESAVEIISFLYNCLAWLWWFWSCFFFQMFLLGLSCSKTPRFSDGPFSFGLRVRNSQALQPHSGAPRHGQNHHGRSHHLWLAEEQSGPRAGLGLQQQGLRQHRAAQKKHRKGFWWLFWGLVLYFSSFF